MAIFGIEGGIGTGKTMTGVSLAMRDIKDGKRCFTNVRFKGLSKTIENKVTYLNKEIIKEMFQKVKDGTLNMKNSVVLIQEMHNYMDSRLSASEKNRTLSYWILQSRHLGQESCDIIYDTQDLGQVDKRLRSNTDYILCPTIAEYFQYVKKKGKKWVQVDAPRVILVDGYFKFQHNPLHIRFQLDVSGIIDLYDTHEVVDF